MYLLPHIGLIWDCYVLNKFIYYSEVWYLNVIYQLLPVKLSTVPKKEIHLRTNYAILSFMKWFEFCVLACWKETNENRNNENKLGSLFLNLFTETKYIINRKIHNQWSTTSLPKSTRLATSFLRNDQFLWNEYIALLGYDIKMFLNLLDLISLSSCEKERYFSKKLQNHLYLYYFIDIFETFIKW